MAEFSMMSAKVDALGLPQINIFWNKCYGVKTSACDIINKILLLDSNSIVDVVMWPKFGNFGISMREVIITSIL